METDPYRSKASGTFHMNAIEKLEFWQEVMCLFIKSNMLAFKLTLNIIFGYHPYRLIESDTYNIVKIVILSTWIIAPNWIFGLEY